MGVVVTPRPDDLGLVSPSHLLDNICDDKGWIIKYKTERDLTYIQTIVWLADEDTLPSLMFYVSITLAMLALYIHYPSIVSSIYALT